MKAGAGLVVAAQNCSCRRSCLGARLRVYILLARLGSSPCTQSSRRAGTQPRNRPPAEQPRLSSHGAHSVFHLGFRPLGSHSPWPLSHVGFHCLFTRLCVPPCPSCPCRGWCLRTQASRRGLRAWCACCAAAERMRTSCCCAMVRAAQHTLHSITLDL